VIQPLLNEIARLKQENAALRSGKEAALAEAERLHAAKDAAVAQGEELRAARDAALADVQKLTKVYEALCHQYSLLRRQLIGPTKERVARDEAQQSLFQLLKVLGRLENREPGAKENAEALLKTLEEAKKKEKPARKPHGRRDLTLCELPTERVVLEPPERHREGGELLEKIGEEVNEVLERRAAQWVRVQIVRPKYKVPNSPLAQGAASNDDVETGTLASPPDTAIVIAPPVELPLPKSMAGPGLLAHVLVSKYADHIPLHRQESICRREGLELRRSTLCDWVAGCAVLLAFVVDAMWEDARHTAEWVATDATGMLVLAKEKCRRVAFYVVLAARDHVLFGAVDTNDGQSVAKLLAGFGGRPMLSDASSVYHEFHRQEHQAGRSIVEYGCWSHARRGAFDALATDRERSLVIIGFIGLLYDVQRETTDAKTSITDGAKRRELAAPIVEGLYRYVEAERPKVAEGTPIAQAFGYLINQKAPLLRFLDDGRLRLDNNLSELELRAEVVGSKNWLFCGSDKGVKSNTTVVSLIASCRLHDIEPWAYVRDVLTLLPDWPRRKVLELAPKYWKKTRERGDVQSKLAALRLVGRTSPRPEQSSGHAPSATL
jgi:transposase